MLVRRYWDHPSTDSALAKTSSGRRLTPTSYPDACRALARLVGEEAALAPSDRCLDVGCGSAEQDLLWRAEFGVESIVAIDPVEAQVRSQPPRKFAMVG